MKIINEQRKSKKKRELINNLLFIQEKLCNMQGIWFPDYKKVIKPMYESKSINQLKSCLRSLNVSVNVNAQIK